MASAEIAALHARDVRSIDIGCMQINLMYHPGAFGSPEAGFELEANVRYAADFLRALRARTGDWTTAIVGCPPNSLHRWRSNCWRCRESWCRPRSILS